MSTDTITATITFLGAAGTVTGSKFLVQSSGKKILVDCGLFQGLKALRLLNWETLPVDTRSIDAVLLTHGHLDHCGYLPCLVKNGYNNTIFATGPTLQVAGIILMDSAKIQQEDADRANRFGYSKHHPALPLYTQDDVKKTIALFREQPINKWINLFDNIDYRFRYAGHIIGATFIELRIGNTVFVFSGDIGRIIDPLIFAPDKPEYADVLLIESTYGNSIHPAKDDLQMASIINTTALKGGTVIIPGFAVERAQLLMYYLWQLKLNSAVDPLPIYLDSPMAGAILKIIQENIGWMKISKKTLMAMVKNIHIVEDYNETLRLCADKHPKIIIAASGMATGGRVLAYLDAFIGGKENTILLAGYQAPGTRGRQLLDGAREIKFYGKKHHVKAQVQIIEGLSAHADQAELIDWMDQLKNKPDTIFIVHGEQEPRISLQKKIKKVYHWQSLIPEMNQTFTIQIK